MSAICIAATVILLARSMSSEPSCRCYLCNLGSALRGHDPNALLAALAVKFSGRPGHFALVVDLTRGNFRDVHNAPDYVGWPLLSAWTSRR